MNNDQLVGSATLSIGVPGMGKSLFLVYCIARFLGDTSFSDKRFALQFYQIQCHYFTPTMNPNVSEYSVQDMAPLEKNCITCYCVICRMNLSLAIEDNIHLFLALRTLLRTRK